MFKITHAVIAAAAIAAAFTVLTASDKLTASPLPEQAQATLKTCTEQPWPYLNCVGTPLGNPRIRLVTSERLGR
jgi:hypothetical protein